MALIDVRNGRSMQLGEIKQDCFHVFPVEYFEFAWSPTYEYPLVAADYCARFDACVPRKPRLFMIPCMPVLPPEVMVHIAQYTAPTTYITFARTCRDMHSLLTADGQMTRMCAVWQQCLGHDAPRSVAQWSHRVEAVAWVTVISRGQIYCRPCRIHSYVLQDRFIDVSMFCLVYNPDGTCKGRWYDTDMLPGTVWPPTKS
jgi:hypothetical protein